GTCDESFSILQDNQLFLNVSNPDVGSYVTNIGCECGVTYNIEYKRTVTGSCGDFTQTLRTDTIFLPCPSTTQPSPPLFSPSDLSCDENEDPLLPEEIKKLALIGNGFKTSSFNTNDTAQLVEDFLTKTKKI